MNYDDEAEEIILELQKVDMKQRQNIVRLQIGDIVKWSYEWIGDLQFGQLYVVTGFKSENVDIVTTRLLDNPYRIKEFHISQLIKV